jgi:hypothetical protein
LGHSFGGILVYEYLKLVLAEKEEEDQLPVEVDGPLDTATTKSISTGTGRASTDTSQERKECCSVILASTPVSIATCQADCDRLLEDIRKELVLEQNNDGDEDDDEDEQQQREEEEHVRGLPVHEHHPPSKQAQDIFWKRHECRVHPMPYALEQALQQSSVQSTAGHGLLQQQQQDPNTNTGTGAGLRDYVATAPTVVTTNAADGAGTSDANSITSITTPIMPPALVLRGQYDFVLESNSLDVWGDLLLNGDDQGTHGNTECMTLAGTSHYAMVEQEDLFGSVVQVFLQKHDPDPAAGQLEQVSVQLPATLVRSPGPRHHQHKQNRLLRIHHNDTSARYEDP